MFTPKLPNSQRICHDLTNISAMSRPRAGCVAVAASIIAITAVYTKRREIVRQVRHAISKYLDETREDPAIEPKTISKIFWKQPVVVQGGKANHPHGKAASARTAAVGAIREMNLQAGSQEASVSMSARDQRDGLKGTRPYMWAKDTDKEPMDDTDNCALTYVDVDFHINELETDLAGRSNHTMIFTIIPQTAASSAETSHTFNDDGTISVDIAGGAHYEHHLWDWTPDMLTCSRRIFGFPYLTTIYKVEKRSINDLKALVLLAPTGTWRGLSAWVASTLSSNVLTRLNCVYNGYAHVRTVTPEGIRHSIAKTGAHTAANIEAAAFDTMSEHARGSKQDPSTSAMATWCDQNRVAAVIVAGYLKGCLGHKAPFVTTTDRSVQSVSANVANHGDEPERVSVSGFMQPIVAGNCHAHTDHPANAEWAAKARITDVAAKTTQQLNPFVATCIREFIELAVPEPLTQADLQAVYEKQTRATQRAIIAEAVDSGPSQRTSLRAFLKKEAYAGEKDPRIITTYGPATKVGYSVYMYALAASFKETDWYGFKKPESVAARVATICSGCDYVIEGDFSRMDGRVDYNVRNSFEKAILHKAFPGDDELLRLHDLQYGQRVVLGKTSYDQGFARGSGSPETSVFNTSLTAFVSYLASRMSGCSKAVAYETIGIVAGDDSLKPGLKDVSPEKGGKAFERAAKQMGQKLTSDIKTIDQPVMFLSRVFGGAWHGDMNSMASPLRLLSKVHSAVNIGCVSAEDKCREKGESILTGDGNTPIIGALARKMTTVGQRLTGENQYQLQTWWAHFEDCSWPNEYADWMEEVIAQEMPGFDYTAFEQWIEAGHALNAPTCYSVTPKAHAMHLIVDGESNGSITSQGTPAKARPEKRKRPGNRTNKKKSSSPSP